MEMWFVFFFPCFMANNDVEVFVKLAACIAHISLLSSSLSSLPLELGGNFTAAKFSTFLLNLPRVQLFHYPLVGSQSVTCQERQLETGAGLEFLRIPGMLSVGAAQGLVISEVFSSLVNPGILCWCTGMHSPGEGRGGIGVMEN